MTEKFVFGINRSTAKKQFEINPRLQRTQATGNRQGLVLGSSVADYPITQNKQIVLPNRAVPQNMNFRKIRKVPQNVINPIQVPTSRSKGIFNTSSGSFE